MLWTTEKRRNSHGFVTLQFPKFRSTLKMCHFTRTVASPLAKTCASFKRKSPCQVSFSGLISWRLTTWNKTLGSRCHYAFAQGVPAPGLEPFRLRIWAGKKGPSKILGWESEKVKVPSLSWSFWPHSIPSSGGQYTAAFFPALARFLPAVQPWLVIYRYLLTECWT